MSEDHVTTLQRGADSVKIHRYGATVTSWNCSGQENLFLSSLSKFDGSKAIRGGIPVVFPNFGPWELGPQHGFARTSWWEVSTPPHQLENGDVEAILRLEDNEKTREMWNHKFELKYRVVMSSAKLTTELMVTNTDTSQFDFTCLLHTYLRVSDITNVKLTGFDGCLYDDKVAGTSNVTEKSKEVTISENVDRIYKKTTSHSICDLKNQFVVEKSNLPDTVLWNPWERKASEMSDFDNSGFKNMVCVEPGHVTTRKVLQPGEVFTCSQTICCYAYANSL